MCKRGHLRRELRGKEGKQEAPEGKLTFEVIGEKGKWKGKRGRKGSWKVALEGRGI